MGEPLLTKSDYTTFVGIQFPELENLAEIQEKNRWRENEISFHDDYRDLCTFDEYTINAFKKISSFFSVADGLINKNLLERFIVEVTDPSARRFYLFQAAMEDVHARTYGLMLAAIVPNLDERMELLEPHKNSQAILGKIKWIEKWIESDVSFSQRMIGFAIVEGIFFSASFTLPYWAKKKGKLPGFVESNELISKDEALHCEFALTVNKYINNRTSENVVVQMMREAVHLEHQFVKEMLPRGLPELTQKMLCDYVEYIANDLLTGIVIEDTDNNIKYCTPIYSHKKCPISWMEKISLITLSSFFEKKPTNYQDSKMAINKETDIFSMDELDDY
jgi:ribonucleotide reductase beta subunit family protein with ferritin-like domain